jgi:glycosyltransferase involved in cell wall biosynthesis
LKILHISTFDSGGAGLSCIRLHKSLLGNGYNSKVLVLKKTTDAPEVYQFEKNIYRLPKIIRWPELFLRLVLHKLKIPVSLYYKLQYKLDSLRAVSSPIYSLPLSDYDLSCHPLVKEADLIHLHWTAGFLDWPSFFDKVIKPVVWTIHDENLYFGGFHYRKEQIDNISIYRKLEEKLVEIKYKSIHQCKNLSIVSLSKMMLKLSLSEEIVKNRKHYLISNSVDHNVFMQFDKKLCRNVFGLPDNKKILIFVSYYLNDKNKGLTELIIALNELKYSDLVLFAIGVGKTEIETSVEILYPGAIVDPRLLPLAYSASDIYVMPSFQEGFAQTPLEAMACGLPVVAFPCSGTEELINERNGIRAADFTVSSLKNSLSQALNTKYDSEWIKQDVLTRFGMKNIIEQYVSVYNNTLDDQIKHE